MRSFTAASAEFRHGESSPVAFLRNCLDRIEHHEQEVQAFEFLNVDRAPELAAASEERWRKGEQLSSIDGMPIGIKDIIETLDMPTQCGSPYFRGHQSRRDSAAVIALRAAGAIILGKTVTTEFAASSPNRTRNPWSPSHTPGGSSSGSAAAVAAGMVPAALGTQVIGSIVRPASFCGVYALKSSVGAVNRGGSHDSNHSQSTHGVLCASLDDGWNVLREIATRVGGDPGHRPLGQRGLPLRPVLPKRIGVLRTAGYTEAEPYARRLFEQLAEALAMEGVEIVSAEEDSLLARIEEAIKDATRKSLEIVGYENIWPYRGYLAQDESKLSPQFKKSLQIAEEFTADDYVGFLNERDAVRETYTAAQATFDAFITLSAPGVAPAGLESTGNSVFNTPASYLGIPAASLPLFMHGGLPLGLQILGFAGSDFETANLAEGIRYLYTRA